MRYSRYAFVPLLGLVLALAGPARAAEAPVEAMAKFIARQQALQSATAKALQADADTSIAEPTGTGSKPCLDSDADGLSDCAESDTGTFVGFNDTGTSPHNPDTDGDGLRDGDEVFGTANGLDLPALGVSPLRRDLLLEYDWFNDDRECAPHTHRPSPGTMARVRAMFAAAPVKNRDGSTGINLIQDYGQGSPFSGGNEILGYDPVLPGTFDQNIRTKHFAANRNGYFHYVLMAHKYNGGSNSSGYAEVVGDDMIVTLGCSGGVEMYVANTIAHELGHNLGLYHGGFEPCNGKPNYNSLMNYRYQFSGIDTQCIASGNASAADFSRGTRLPLDENAIDERVGVCGSPAIDWNFNGTLEPSVAQDLNAQYNNVCGPEPMRTLDDFDDWNGITFAGVLSQHPAVKSLQEEVACGGAPAPAGLERSAAAGHDHVASSAH